MNLPGIPPLLIPFDVNRVILAPTVVFTVLKQIIPAPPQIWGVFDADGTDVIVADTLVSFDYRNDWKISDYPQEQGAFGSYNKVSTPFDIRLRFSCGGSESDRTEFLTNAQTVAASLDLYSVVTPEATYINCNIAHIDYHREQREGAARIVLDVWLNEIRQATGTTGLSVDNTKIPTSSDPESAGQVQAVDPTPNDLSALA